MSELTAAEDPEGMSVVVNGVQSLTNFVTGINWLYYYSEKHAVTSLCRDKAFLIVMIRNVVSRAKTWSHMVWSHIWCDVTTTLTNVYKDMTWEY